MLESLSFVHRFEKGSEADTRPLLLLHGSGGDENDLVQLGHGGDKRTATLTARKGFGNGLPRSSAG